MLIDTASNGYFLGQQADQEIVLVENLAMSDGNYDEDYDRSIRKSGSHEDQTRRKIMALSEKFDKLMKISQRQMNFVRDFDGQQ